MSEVRHLTILKENDIEEAINYCKIVINIYRTSVLRSRKRGYSQPHHASLDEYRRGFINSYIVFRKFLQSYNRYGNTNGINI